MFQSNYYNKYLKYKKKYLEYKNNMKGGSAAASAITENVINHYIETKEFDKLAEILDKSEHLIDNTQTETNTLYVAITNNVPEKIMMLLLLKGAKPINDMNSKLTILNTIILSKNEIYLYIIYTHFKIKYPDADLVLPLDYNYTSEHKQIFKNVLALHIIDDISIIYMYLNEKSKRDSIETIEMMLGKEEMMKELLGMNKERRTQLYRLWGKLEQRDIEIIDSLIVNIIFKDYEIIINRQLDDQMLGLVDSFVKMITYVPKQAELHPEHAGLQFEHAGLHPGSHAGLHPEHAGLHPEHTGLHPGSHTGLQFEHAGLHPEHAGLHPEHAGLHPEHAELHPEHAGLHPEHAGLHPGSHAGLQFKHAGLHPGSHTGLHPEHAGSHPKHAGLHPEHAGLHPGSHPGLQFEHAGLHPGSHAGLHPEHAGLHPEHAGLHPEHAGLHPEHAGLHPGSHTGLEFEHAGLHPEQLAIHILRKELNKLLSGYKINYRGYCGGIINDGMYLDSEGGSDKLDVASVCEEYYNHFRPVNDYWDHYHSPYDTDMPLGPATSSVFCDEVDNYIYSRFSELCEVVDKKVIIEKIKQIKIELMKILGNPKRLKLEVSMI